MAGAPGLAIDLGSVGEGGERLRDFQAKGPGDFVVGLVQARKGAPRAARFELGVEIPDAVGLLAEDAKGALVIDSAGVAHAQGRRALGEGSGRLKVQPVFVFGAHLEGKALALPLKLGALHLEVATVQIEVLSDLLDLEVDHHGA